MANRKKVYIDIEVNGKMQKVAVDAKNLGKSLDDVSKGALQTDRNLKGVAQASSNSTKNFSKMAQGIGGTLVPAYATLAAQLFAIDAAFRFLKESGDLAALKEGQVAYAAATGIAMKTLTNRIIEATDAQLGFRDASQAAAIGVASGLSPQQLTELAGAAKDVSLVLGRDLTDSFNRLIRGVTKAEPELLDELGVILRLEDAAKKYKDALGIKGELTTFQKSQAVTADVLGQVEDKYSKILDIVNPSVNKFNQLGKAFDDIINKAREVAAVFAGPLATVITETPSIAFAAFALMGKGIITSAIPAVGELQSRLEDAGKAARQNAEDIKKQIRSYKSLKRVKELTPDAAQELKQTSFVDARKVLKDAEIQAKKGGLAKILAGDYQAVNNRMISQMKITAEKGIGEYAKMTKAQRALFIQMLNDIQLANAQANDKMLIDTSLTMDAMEAKYLGASATAKGAFASMSSFGAKALGFIGRVINVLGWLAFAYTIYEVAKEFFNLNKKLSDTEKKQKEQIALLDSLTSDYEKFAEVQREITKNGQGLLQYLEAFNNYSSSLSTEQAEIALKSLTKSQDKYALSVEKARLALEKYKIAETETYTAGSTDGVPFADISRMAVQKGNEGKARESFSQFIARTGDEEQKKSLKFFQQQLDGMKAINDERANSITSFKAYRDLLDSFLNDPASNVTVKQVLQGKSAWEEFSSVLDGTSRMQQENASKTKAIFDSIAPDTQFDQAQEGLRKEIGIYETIQKDLIKNGSKLSESEQKRLDIAKERLALVDLIEQNQQSQAATQRSIALEEANAMLGASNAAQQRIKNETAIAKKQAEIQKILDDESVINEKVAQNKGVVTEQIKEQRIINEDNKKIAEAELKILEAQTKELEFQAALNKIKNKAKIDSLQATVSEKQALLTSAPLERSLFDATQKKEDLQRKITEQTQLYNATLADANLAINKNNEDKQQAVELAREELNLSQAELKLAEQREVFEASNLRTKKVLRGLQKQELLDSIKLTRASIGLTNNQKEKLELRFKIAGADRDISESLRKEQELREKIANSSGDLKTELQEDLSLQQLKTQELEAQKEVLVAQTSQAYLLQQALKNSLESGLQSNIKDLITGKQTSFKDAFRNIFEGVVDSIADVIAKDMTDSIMTALSKIPGLGKLAPKNMPQQIQAAHQVGAATVSTAITTANTTAATQSQTSNKVNAIVFSAHLDAAFDRGADRLKKAIEEACASCSCSDKGITDSGITITSAPAVVNKDEELDRRDEIIANTRRTEILEATKKTGSAVYDTSVKSDRTVEDSSIKIAKTVAKTSEDSTKKIVKAIESLSDDKSNSILDQLGPLMQIFGAGGEGGGGGGIMDIFKILTSGGGITGDTTSSDSSGIFDIVKTIFSFFGGGGSARYGGIMPQMAVGGVLKGPDAGYPVMMHGKEAVVPLPGNGKIPVELRGSTGENNNVVVNVSIDNRGVESSSSEGDANEFGRAISIAVRKEIQNQRRAGGTLSPYGAS